MRLYGERTFASAGAKLSEQARSALARCLPVLEDALTRRGRGSLRALVESTWLRLGGPACLADREQGIRDSECIFCAAGRRIFGGHGTRCGELCRETA